MSNLPQIIITAETDVILKKKQAWAEVGFTVHNTNLQLESAANEALSLLVPPSNIDQVSEAESILKDAKSRLSAIEADRKVITSKFDAVTSALMIHEKKLKDALGPFSQAIIEVKKAHEAEILRKQKEQEQERLKKEYACNYVSSETVRISGIISDQCQKAFEYALNKDIPVEQLQAYLVKVKKNKTLADFTITCPNGIDLSHFTEACVKLDAPTAEYFMQHFHIQVDKKFEFYNVALKNKSEAIQAAKEAAEAEELRLAENLSNAGVAIKLESIAAATAEIQSDVKELKKKYELDMPDNESSALLIITAFVTNFAQAKDGLRVKSMMKLSIEQMGTALAWMKNKDDAFSCTGIKFKVTEKL